MFIFIIGFAILVVLVFTASALMARSNKKARKKQITKLIEQAEAGQQLAKDYVFNEHLRSDAVYFKLIDRYDAIARDENLAREAKDILADATIFHAYSPLLSLWHDRSKRPELRLDALDRFIDALRLTRHSINRRIFLATLFGIQADKLPQIITDDYARGATDRFRYRRYRDFVERLCRTAGESYDDFCSLEKIVEAWNKTATGSYRMLYPADWNAWVVQYKANPSFYDFVDQKSYSDLPKGTVSIRMAEAIRTADIVELAITLSYCNVPKPYWAGSTARCCRDEVGDVLYAEAVKLYEALRAQGTHLMASS